MVCWFLQDFSKVKGSSLHLIWYAHTALYFVDRALVMIPKWHLGNLLLGQLPFTFFGHAISTQCYPLKPTYGVISLLYVCLFFVIPEYRQDTNFKETRKIICMCHQSHLMLKKTPKFWSRSGAWWPRGQASEAMATVAIGNAKETYL